ncbi:MAG: hypothetical protein U9Q76_10510 [candidate division WOR-3 bacterium]|nr:hypothetical protein [candidate division WOR-3 bacterium]
MTNGRRIPAWLWIGGIAVIVIVGIFILPTTWQWLRTPETPGDHNKYLLSATAQVLGALFALVFSITLIATQFVTKYTHRTMEIIFNKKVIAYMILFAGATVLPLGCLSNPTSLGAIISVIVGSIFVLSVPGFFWYLKGRMNIEGIISFLKKQALKEVVAGNEMPARKKISALDNIGMGAYTDRNFEVFELAYSAIADFALEMEKKVERITGGLSVDEIQLYHREVHRIAFQVFHDTCEETIDNPRAPRILIRCIGNVGIEACKEKLWVTWQKVGKLLVFYEGFANPPNEDFSVQRRWVSLHCIRTLHELSKNLDFSEKMPLGRFQFIEKEISIYRKHMNQGWLGVIDNDLFSVASRIRKYISLGYYQKKGGWWTLLDHLFEYLEFFIKHNLLDQASLFCQQLGNSLPPDKDEPLYGIIIEIFKAKIPEHLTKRIIQKLIQLGDAYLERYNEDWRHVGLELYEKAAWLSAEAINSKLYDLGKFGLDQYLPQIKQGNLWSSDVKLPVLFNLIARPTEILIKEKQLVAEERLTTIVTAITQVTLTWISIKYTRGYWPPLRLTDRLDTPVPKLVKDRNPDIEKRAWKDVKPFAKKLLSFALNKRWPSAMLVLYEFYIQITRTMYEEELVLPEKDLFQGIWLTLASLLDLENLSQKIPASLAKELKERKLTESFLAEYDKVESKVRKDLKGPLKETEGRIRRELYLIGELSRP